ncbi:MAG: zinc ribbon domain-containing protein [Methanomassiliicoccales archaeon]|nr:zinc ribbon domain-containing protein [Methanomassiliicoccales archaeon]
MAGQDSGAGKEEDMFEFDCPDCGYHIKGETTKCPNCGVEFVIEEVAETVCPVCGEAVSPEAATCPKCGASFESTEAASTAAQPAPPIEMAPPAPAAIPAIEAEKGPEFDEAELRKKFPELVAEVKPLLTLAKENDVDVSDARRLIDKAVHAGKERDIVSAVRYVKECQASLRSAIDARLDRETQYLEKLIEVAKSMGSDPTGIGEAIAKVKERRAQGDLPGALLESKEGKKAAEKLTGKYIEANELADELEKLIAGCERFYVDVRESHRLLSEARDAGEHGDWSMMGILARKGREEVLKTLPDILTSELKKARTQLLDAKAQGKDVSTLVKVLKEAGTATKAGKYEESVERLLEFKSEAKYI